MQESIDQQMIQIQCEMSKLSTLIDFERDLNVHLSQGQEDNNVNDFTLL
jgi:hypothetical protein